MNTYAARFRRVEECMRRNEVSLDSGSLFITIKDVTFRLVALDGSGDTPTGLPRMFDHEYLEVVCREGEEGK